MVMSLPAPLAHSLGVLWIALSNGCGVTFPPQASRRRHVQQFSGTRGPGKTLPGEVVWDSLSHFQWSPCPGDKV